MLSLTYRMRRFQKPNYMKILAEKVAKNTQEAPFDMNYVSLMLHTVVIGNGQHRGKSAPLLSLLDVYGALRAMGNTLEKSESKCRILHI
jgi:hypothetical protein